jgi:hypothetical protein
VGSEMCNKRQLLGNERETQSPRSAAMLVALRSGR